MAYGKEKYRSFLESCSLNREKNETSGILSQARNICICSCHSILGYFTLQILPLVPTIAGNQVANNCLNEAA